MWLFLGSQQKVFKMILEYFVTQEAEKASESSNITQKDLEVNWNKLLLTKREMCPSIRIIMVTDYMTLNMFESMSSLG